MKRITALLLQLARPATAATMIALSAIAVAPSVLAGQPALTIYNQNFAVVRDTVPIDLKQGVNNVRFTETTAHLRPASDFCVDRPGKRICKFLSRIIRNDPVRRNCCSAFRRQDHRFSGDPDQTAESTIVQGKMLRRVTMQLCKPDAMQRYGQNATPWPNRRWLIKASGMSQPIIEVDGKLRFTLPGQPLFRRSATTPF
jgi:hypothetical protein